MMVAAAIGSAVGAGAGGGVVLATRGDEVHVPAGTVVTTFAEALLSASSITKQVDFTLGRVETVTTSATVRCSDGSGESTTDGQSDVGTVVGACRTR